MDLGKLVQTDKTFELDLLHPVTDKPLGVKFQIRSSESEQVKSVDRNATDELLAKQKKKVKADQIVDQYLDRAAMAVASWDWGKHECGGLDLTHSFENVRAVLEAHGWIYEQVSEASEARANFTAK